MGLAFMLTGSAAAAEDLSQDAFFAAFRRWDDVQHYDNPGAWVRRIVINRSVSLRRRLGSEAKALVRLGGRRAGVGTFGEISERDHQVVVMIQDLPRRQAQVLALTYFDDLSLTQVAAILQISEDTAKTHLRRARSTLADRATALGLDATGASDAGELS